MKALRTRLKDSYALPALCVVLLAALAIYPAAPIHSQGVGTHITGTAWSDYIGWINLDCATIAGECAKGSYNLGVDSAGGITGWAWSDEGGWISAYQSDTGMCGAAAGCPSGSNACISGSAVKGWLRMLSAQTPTDGCIQLNPGQAQDVTYSGGTITGNAWGGDLLGWVQFNAAANLSPAMCTMNATPSSYYALSAPTSLLLSYTTQNAVTASIDQGQGSVTTGTGSKTVSPAPSSGTRYTMTVANTAGSTNTCYTDVTVNSGYAPPAGCISVGAGNPSCVAPVIRSAHVRKGTGATLYWSVSDVDASGQGCKITANGTDLVVGQPGSGSAATGALTQRTEYVLTCAGRRPGTNFVDRAVINIIPEFKEI